MTKPSHLIIVDYDPRWPALFEAEHARLRRALAPVPAAIHHMGSTAVPGLAAKPIIDILIQLPSMPPEPRQMQALDALGYEHLGEHGVPGREYFRCGVPRQFQIHMFAAGHPAAADHLAFRDYLRRNADAAREYAGLKRRAAMDAATMQEYVHAKADFVASILGRAPHRPGST